MYSSCLPGETITCIITCFGAVISFQFVVCDSGDYTVHIVDPDVLVDWTLIEQVVCS